MVQKLVSAANLDRGEWVSVVTDGKTRSFWGDCRLRNQTFEQALAEEDKLAKEDGATHIVKSDSHRPSLPKSPSRDKK
jgi:hypothetical protein